MTGDTAATLRAEIGILALALATTAGFVRVFEPPSFIPRLALIVVISWLSSLMLRRLGAGAATTLALHLMIGVITLTLVFLPATSLYGLPTIRTLEVAQRAVSRAFAQAPDLVSPIHATTGFLLAIAAGVWIFGLFADTAAVRFGATIQAPIPYLTTFLLVGIPAREHGRVVAAIVFVCGLAIYTGLVSGGSHKSRPSAQRLLIGTAVAASVTALAVPAGLEPLVNLRRLGQGGEARTVVSPFVGIRSLLGGRSNAEMFTVTANTSSYWRLTSLDTYDESKDIWVSNGTYSKVEGRLHPKNSVGEPTRPISQRFHIVDLGTAWIPAAFEPVEVHSENPLTFDQASSSLIPEDDAAKGLDYEVLSMVPLFSSLPTDDRRLDPSENRANLKRLTETPHISTKVRRIFNDVTRSASGPFDKLILLQNWFRSQFDYDETVDFSGSSNPLSSFIAQRAGFCQQFASAFAILARYAGYPSRVAVGFTQGDIDRSLSTSTSSTFVVRGRHAHAWPEVYLAGAGWLSFEPTPGRGNPAIASYTGVTAAQAAEPEPDPSATTSSSTVGASTVAPTSSLLPDDQESIDTSPDVESTKNGSSTRKAIVVVVLAVLTTALALQMTRRWRAEHKDAEPLDIREPDLFDSWIRTVQVAKRLGVEPRDTETPLEFVSRVFNRLREESLSSLDFPRPVLHDQNDSSAVARNLEFLAATETQRRYGPHGIGQETVDRAKSAVATIEALVPTTQTAIPHRRA